MSGIGILFIAIGIFMIWLSSKPVIDEAQFDLYAAEDMAYIDTLNILEQYGKDPSELVAPPYTMTAPDFNGAGLLEFAWRWERMVKFVIPSLKSPKLSCSNISYWYSPPVGIS